MDDHVDGRPDARLAWVDRLTALVAEVASSADAELPLLTSAAAASLAGLLGADAMLIYELSPDRATLLLRAHHGVVDEALAEWATVPLEVADPVAEAVRRGSDVWAEDALTLGSRFPPVASRGEEPLLVLAAPLAVDDDVRGVLAAAWRGARPFGLGEALPEQLLRSTVRALSTALAERAQRTRPFG